MSIHAIIEVQQNTFMSYHVLMNWTYKFIQVLASCKGTGKYKYIWIITFKAIHKIAQEYVSDLI